MKLTYLYIKQHTVTGLKYLGKTTKSNPYKYRGSGVKWLKHLKVHGKEHVKTLWVSEPFVDEDSLVEFATFMSEELDIVNSDKWANLIVENGLNSGGGMLGKSHSKNTRKIISDCSKTQIRYPMSEETKAKLSAARKGIPGKAPTEETKAKMRESHKARKPISEETRLKMKEGVKNRPPVSEETKQKMRLASIERMKIRKLKKESK